MRSGFYERHEEFTNKLHPFIFHDIEKNRDSEVSAHWHKNIELLYCVNGSANVIISGERYILSPNTLICMGPNIIHAIQNTQSVDYYCLITTDKFCSENGIDVYKKTLPTQIYNTDLRREFEELYKDFKVNGYADITKKRLDVLSLVYSLYKEYSFEDSQPAKSYDEIAQVIEYIYDNYAKDITLEDASRIAGWSKYYLIKKFKQATGTTFVSFLNHVRCDNAAELIANGMSVSDAAFACGFHDPAFFSRTFKKQYNEKP